MGRVKLKIKRLESSSNRQVTYSKRRNGILKKAKELSILCDIDIILLMFSPTGRATLFHGERSNLEDVIMKFSQLTPQERAKRKMESLEALRKTFKKLDHDVNIHDFLGLSSQTVEELTDQVRLMHVHLSEAHKRLSCWSNPDKIDSIEHLREMEDSLRESITRIRLHKETLVKHQLMPLECASQSGMPLSLMMSDVQGAHSLSWLANNCDQHQMLSNDPNFLSHRDVKCSTDASLPVYSAYFGTGKQRERENLGSVDNIRKDGALSELSTSACLGFELGDHLSYRPYCTSNLPNSKKLEPGMPSNTHGNRSVYQVNSNFELLRPISDDRHHAWVSASGPSSISMFDENSYHQQSN